MMRVFIQGGGEAGRPLSSGRGRWSDGISLRETGSSSSLDVVVPREWSRDNRVSLEEK